MSKKRKIEEVSEEIPKKLPWNHPKCEECLRPQEKKEFFESCKICEDHFCSKCDFAGSSKQDTILRQVPLRYLQDEDGTEYGEFICDECIERVTKMEI
jgi:hypothetical protein